MPETKHCTSSKPEPNQRLQTTPPTLMVRSIGPLVTARQAASQCMYLDLGRWITGSALCLSGPLKRLAYSRIDLLCCSSQGNRTPDILYETCACIIHTINLQLHVQFIIIETLHDQSFSLMASEDSLRDSIPPVTGCPRTKGQES